MECFLDFKYTPILQYQSCSDMLLNACHRPKDRNIDNHILCLSTAADNFLSKSDADMGCLLTAVIHFSAQVQFMLFSQIQAVEKVQGAARPHNIYKLGT